MLNSHTEYFNASHIDDDDENEKSNTYLNNKLPTICQRVRPYSARWDESRAHVTRVVSAHLLYTHMRMRITINDDRVVYC